MKERWFNYRPLCLVFGFLLLGSVFAFYTPKHAIITIAIMVITLVALTLLSLHKKKPQYVLVPLIAFVVGLSMYYLAVYNFNKTVDYTPKTIQARIYCIADEKDGMISVEADSVKFNNKKINDNIKLYIYDNDGLFENIKIGSVIEFKPNKFYKSDLFYYQTPNTNLYTNDLKYTVSAVIDDVKYLETNKTFSEKIKERVKDNLSLGLTNENTEIAYSALFGDKELLSDKQYNTYKLSGVAHLLAVSGLHVGIIVGIFNTMLNFKKRKTWWKFALIVSFLLFYMYACGFAVSIIRASIMSIVLMIATLLGKEYDSFNSIAVAGIIIFIINPLCIFDIAFLLSFSCVIGITMLFKPINMALEKTHIPKSIVKSVAISLSTTISIVLIMAYYFRTLNIISIIANAILIPIFTVAFTAVFLISLISLPFRFLSYLAYPINCIFDFINLLSIMLGNLSISSFNTIEFNFIAIIVYFILLLFLGRFCTAKYQYKIISTVPMVALLFYCLL